MRRALTLASFILAICFPTASQIPHSTFLHYTSDQGLSNDHITGIVKDKLGFIWISTVNGLNRFDGQSFKIFRHNPNDPNSLIYDDIVTISLAPDGWIWIPTSRGICKLDPASLRFERIHLPENTDTLDNDFATMVGFDSKGYAWTTTERGIYQLNPVTDKVEFFLPTAVKTLGWFGMLIDSRDRIWMLKDTLRRLDPDRKEIKFFMGQDPVMTMYNGGPLSVKEDEAGRIWVGTWGAGVWEFDEAKNDFVRRSDPNLAMMVLPDKDEEGKPFFWIGGGKSGLSLFHPETQSYFEFLPDPEDPFTHNNYLATHLMKDPDNGDVWIGTEVGLEHYAPATIRFHRALIPTESDMGQFSLVSGVVHDQTDPTGQRYFIGVWGTGLFQWDRGTNTFTRMRSNTSMTNYGNYYIFQDRQGYIWSCSLGEMSRYHPQKKEWKKYDCFQHKERNNLFWFGMEDKKGNLWFASNKEGLFKYNRETDKVELALFDEELIDGNGWLNIRYLSEDVDGNIWLAAINSGLIRYSPASGKAKKFFYSGTNIGNACTSVVASKSGKIYAVFHSALIELDANGNYIRHFAQHNGLKSNHLMFLLEDQHGKIWFNSEHLLHCFDPETDEFRYYGKPDGLFSNAMTDAFVKTPDGEFFIGFQNAFNYFNPSRLKQNLQPPPVAITSIKVMNKERNIRTCENGFGWMRIFSGKSNSYCQDSFLLLKPNEDFFEIQFAALNFNQQERNQYAYKLDGFHKDWVFTDRPVATFTNLDGGDYVLHMKAANNDGVWNESGTSLTIIVKPPFYKTNWFVALMAIALFAGISGVIWFRRQQRQRLEVFRERLARDLHDEMGSTLSSIRFFSEYATQQVGNEKPEIKPVLQRISDSASNMSESMQDIIWAMKHTSDDLEDLTTHMTEFALRIFEARNVRFRTFISDEFHDKNLKPDVRRNIYLIFKEAVNNAAKYAQAGLVELHLSLKNGYLVMKIKDDGQGFVMEETGAGSGGNGLKNMDQRAKEINGRLAIHTEVTKGTTVELWVKV